MQLSVTLSAVFTAILLLPAGAFGQQNYQPAKVITLADDTLRGYINYRSWDQNPRTVSFKPDLQAPEQHFRALDIKGFSVSSEQYAGARISVENSSQELNNLTTTATPSYRADTVFLRTLVAGPKSLYECKDANGYHFFYVRQDGGRYDLLVFKRYKAPGDGAPVVQLNNTFRDQLARYLADCPSIEPKLKAITYTASALQRAFASYYACTSQALSFQHRSKIKHQVGVLAGIAQTRLLFSNVKNPEYPTFDSYTQVRPTGGIYYTVSLPGSLRFSVSNAVVFSSFSGSGYLEQPGSTSSIYRKTTASMSLSYLKLHTLLRYTRPLGAGAVFINAGVSNGYAIQVESEKVVRERFYSSETTTTTKLFSGFRRYEQGLVAGIGGSFARLSAEARYEYSNGFHLSQELGSGFDRYSLLVGFRLY